LRVTIKDIAERAGVSKTTVSFAFNDPSRISAETYKRVMAIVTELGYVPDPVARTLTTKRLGAIGLLLPQPIQEALANPYLCEIIRGIGEVCEERELALTMLPPVKGRIVEAARRAAVDALLTIGVGPGSEVTDILERRHLPFVTIDGAESEHTVNVGVDDESVSYALMRHILGLGHRRIAVLALRPEFYNPPDECFSVVIDSRLAGFGRALAECGLDFKSPGVRVVPAEGSLEGGARAGLELLSRPEAAPTAIIAMADAAALGVYEACKVLGLSIPRDVSVTGFDDIPLAAIAEPPLTTVHQPGREKGSTAASLALHLRDGEPASHRVLAAELIVRSSTARPPLQSPALPAARLP
jgi:alanine racemase